MLKKKQVKRSFSYANKTLTIETGKIAKQATSAVMATYGDTVVIATLVAATSSLDATRDFFPLTCNYQEKYYAAGRFPSGYVKREGRPSIRETLISRLIDRPIRPLFSDDFTAEVQIVVTLLSLDPEVDSEIISMIAASAALAISGLPTKGILGAAKVGYCDGRFILNPTNSELKTSQLDLTVAGTEEAILMVESEAQELPESTMLEGVLFGHREMQGVIAEIKEFAKEVAAPEFAFVEPQVDPVLRDKIMEIAENRLKEAFTISDKVERNSTIGAINADVFAATLVGEDANNEAKKVMVQKIFNKLEKQIVRSRILNEGVRIDGRNLTTIRPITVEAGLLPRVHGSALFTRGETQALCTTTLGLENCAQSVDALSGEYQEYFMLHYNFPPFCVGEIGQIGSPKRREIGHGNLARRALKYVVPSIKEFPYSIRVVSEIMESNGSSSMATVCGGCLSLMDAGVPLKAPVAGIAMGLIKEGDQFVVLSDILGDEDHFGDMDFKVAGTANGVTALQMDIKIAGITKEIMEIALNQAHAGRMHILGIMTALLPAPRDHISCYAPKITSFKINPKKIKDVIGKGGAVIRGIIEETGVAIDIDDNGNVKIASANEKAALNAQNKINEIIAEAEVGKIYKGKVVKIVDFGAFVNILPDQDGLLHISQICEERIKSVADKLKEGQFINVKVLEIDNQNRIKLTMKGIDQTDL